EVWPPGCVYHPARGQHRDFAKLAARHTVAWPEGAVAVTGDDTQARQTADVRIEGAPNGYIDERLYIAQRRRGERRAGGGGRRARVAVALHKRLDLLSAAQGIAHNPYITGRNGGHAL